MSLKLMFDSVAREYDLLNSVLTWKLDEVWRGFCARECASGAFIVDLCCGTGNLALHISNYSSSRALVVGLDFSRAMLNRALSKKLKEKRKRRCNDIRQNKARVNACDINFILADATCLPFRHRCIDRIGVSFSFRNLVYRNPNAMTCLKEIVRVLQPRGKFVCIETSQPRPRLLRILYHLYLRKVVPFVGGLVSRRESAYRYLGVSATNFPAAEEIAYMLSRAGFPEVSFKRMTFGVVALHLGNKIVRLEEDHRIEKL